MTSKHTLLRSLAAFCGLIVFLLGPQGALADALDQWTAVIATPKENFRAIAAGPAGLIAFGTDDVLLQSSDAATWRTPNGTSGLYTIGLDYVNGLYLASVREKQLPHQPSLLISEDLVSWTRRDLTDFPGVRFAYGAGVYVGVSGTLSSSPNGYDWTSHGQLMTGLEFGIA